jgi:hypothetical protein
VLLKPQHFMEVRMHADSDEQRIQRCLTTAMHAVHADRLHQELVTRFKAPAAQIRTAHGKEAGTVRFTQDGHTIVADLPKRVEYDQKKLRVAVDELRARGENPNDYVAFEISISEAAWNGYTPSMRELFQDARTVKTGKPTFELIKLAPDAIPDPSNDNYFRST